MSVVLLKEAVHEMSDPIFLENIVSLLAFPEFDSKSRPPRGNIIFWEPELLSVCWLPLNDSKSRPH